MPDIFLATLGERPEAITIGLDALTEQFPISTAVMLHTNPTLSPISKAYSTLRSNKVKEAFPTIEFQFREIKHLDGSPIVDIENEYTSDSYFQGIYDALADYHEFGNLHLLIAGGRKIMSVYAVLAASLVFGGRDHLWTVHSPPDLIENKETFRIPATMRERVHLIQLPIRTMRTWVNKRLDDPKKFLDSERNLRESFLARLTSQESKVTSALEKHPHASNEELGVILVKSSRTIENQLRTIYGKLYTFLDIPPQERHKRRMLLDLLRGEL